MKYVHEFRQPEAVKRLADKIAGITTQSWTLMEICGGQTHTIVKYALQQLLPKEISLIHGPGCPVCVTPIAVIDQAIELARNRDVIFCTFGDMLRVPGSHQDLMMARAEGADVRIVYSPLDAVGLAEQCPEKEVVFLAIGFETTTAANAMAVYQAKQKALANFSMLVSQFQVPPAIESLCSSSECRIQAFLAAGHVCTVMGYQQYRPLARKYRIPIVVTGFEPLDILEAVFHAVRLLERHEASVENCYTRAVTEEGNRVAQDLIAEVFESTQQEWRGIGILPNSGFKLARGYRDFDAAHRFARGRIIAVTEKYHCISGSIMQGLKKPPDCVHFGTRCRPESPLGAPMVSAEGACSAYYKFAR